jgi:Predicted nucleic acid-binding protein, contains PIN domain
MRSPTCDTSPILYLLLINQIELLPRLYQTIIIPDVESILGYAMLPSKLYFNQHKILNKLLPNYDISTD